jgi:pimeloyl-ACP methyl ester carboxylesterase
MSYSGLANAQQNKTLMQPQGLQAMATNTTNMNIVLVHGAWADGSSWSKVIPILKNAGHSVIAKLMHENIKGSQLVQIEKAGHGFYFEERERVNSEIIKFIG